jgi:hypothetical protein
MCVKTIIEVGALMYTIRLNYFLDNKFCTIGITQLETDLANARVELDKYCQLNEYLEKEACEKGSLDGVQSTLDHLLPNARSDSSSDTSRLKSAALDNTALLHNNPCGIVKEKSLLEVYIEVLYKLDI